jgi:hypothetical protein
MVAPFDRLCLFYRADGSSGQQSSEPNRPVADLLEQPAGRPASDCI